MFCIYMQIGGDTVKKHHSCEKCTYPLGTPKRKEKEVLVYTCTHCGHINLKSSSKKA